MFKFIKTIDESNPHDISNIEIIIPNNDVSLDQLLGVVEDYFKACGFVFQGHLDFIDDDDVA